MVSGIVLDAAAATPLQGATVSIQGTSLSAAAGRDGRFQLVGVPAGEQKLVVGYLGHEPTTTTVAVTAGQVLSVEVKLRETVMVREEVTVTATPIQEGQARALNRQRTAPNIVNVISSDQIGQFPDSNAAEATQRVPGVTIERDQGEGRYVAVRGTEPRLNSMMINGERIPSPEGDIRAVALDVVPTDLLEAIEVTKALTPDMDADAIGGAVNLITRGAPSRPMVFGTIAGGYNSLMRDWGQGTFNGTAGRRFAGSKLGFILTGSANDVNRGSDNFEAEYDGADLAAFELRDYTINRERYGLNGALDYQFSPGSSWNLRGIFNSFSDQEYRRRAASAIEDNELEWELKDRLETQIISSFSTDGRHLLGNGMLFDYAASVSFSEEDEPGAYYTVFKQEDVNFRPGHLQPNPLNADIEEAAFDEQSIENNITTDRDVVAGLNLRFPLAASPTFAGSVRIGGKYRHKVKDRDARTTVFETDDDIFMNGILESGFDPKNFLRGRYGFGPFFSPQSARGLNGRPDFESEDDPEADLADYHATERIAAGYAMAELAFGPKLTLLPGVRFERTMLDYRGFTLDFDDEGDFDGIAEARGEGNYGQALPGVHLRYAVTPESNFRAAFTRSLARPNYYDLVPYQVVFEEDLEIERGNPTLRPSTSWNIDFMGERYFRSVGLIRAASSTNRSTTSSFRFDSRKIAAAMNSTSPNRRTDPPRRSPAWSWRCRTGSASCRRLSTVSVSMRITRLPTRAPSCPTGRAKIFACRARSGTAAICQPGTKRPDFRPASP